MADKRYDIKAIMRDQPNKWRELQIRCIIATQAREGITTTYEQAAAAYDKVMKEAPEIRKRADAAYEQVIKSRKR